MSRTLLNEKTAASLLERANTLSTASTSMWGSMDVTDMLYHCNTINHSILQGKATEQHPTLKQRLLKTLVLRLMRRLPKGVKTNPQFIRSKTDTTAFEKEHERFRETLLRFVRHPEAIAGKHPLFGPMNTKDWRRFVWMHTDHHLRQFGA